MSPHRYFVRSLALAASALTSGMVGAADLKYDFVIDWQQGQLAGTQSVGWFSYDSSLATPNGVVVNPNVLSGFELTIRDVHFGLGSVTAPVVAFNAAGELDQIFMGTGCSVTGPIPWGTCFVQPGNIGSFYLNVNYHAGFFNASVGDGPPSPPQVGLSQGVVTVVPEPTSALLLLSGALAVAARSRRRVDA